MTWKCLGTGERDENNGDLNTWRSCRRRKRLIGRSTLIRKIHAKFKSFQGLARAQPAALSATEESLVWLPSERSCYRWRYWSRGIIQQPFSILSAIRDDHSSDAKRKTVAWLVECCSFTFAFWPRNEQPASSEQEIVEFVLTSVARESRIRI